MKICLVNLPSPFLINEKVFPNLGLLYISSALKQYGHEVYVHDGRIEDIPLRNYDIYGISSTTPQFPLAIKALERIKILGYRVIIGGPHATVDPQSCLDVGFDTAVVGEGEVSVHYACKFMPQKAFSPLPFSLDTYLNPDRDAIDIKSYKYFIDGELATTVMTSRGCPFKCAFCSKTVPKVKMRNAENVLKELADLHVIHGYNAFMFFDDTFILNKQRVLEICEGIKDWGIKWRCFVRADLVIKHGDELLKAMAEAGCKEVGMGIESGSDKILKIINKGESVSIMSKAIKMCQKYGIRVKGFFIIGLPGENWITIDETKRFLEKNPLDDVDFTVFTPYPGSPIFHNKEKYDINWDLLEYKKMFYKGKPDEYECLVWTSALDKDQILSTRNWLEKYYKKW